MPGGSTVETSILKSMKKLLGMEPDYDAFDTDIIIAINSVFATLQQLAVGPKVAFEIQDDTKTWADFMGSEANINSVKSYMYLKVRLIFDPPETSYARESFRKQAEEYEWRLNVQVEGVT